MLYNNIFVKVQDLKPPMQLWTYSSYFYNQLMMAIH